MENNKIVKNITKGLIFSLCCILTIASIPIPTHALDDDGYSLTGISVDLWGSGLTQSLINDTVVDYYPTLPQLDYDILNLLEDPSTFSPQNTNIFEFPNLSVGRSFTIRIPLDTTDDYTYDIRVTHIKTVWDGTNRVNQEVETVFNATDIVFGTVEINVAIRDAISIRIAHYPNAQPILPRGDMTIIVNVDDEIRQVTTPAPPENPDDDSYSNAIIELLFRPVQALHSAVIFDLNGTEQGGEITIGAIFIAILGVYGLTAFLKHFAGG